MFHRPQKILLFLVAFLCGLLFWGSAAQANYDESDLEGTWIIHGITPGEHKDGNYPADHWVRGEIELDPSGQGDIDLDFGPDKGDDYILGANFSISNDGIISMDDNPYFRGVLSANKDVMVITTHQYVEENGGNGQEFLQLGVGIREEGGFSSGDLDGDWKHHLIEPEDFERESGEVSDVLDIASDGTVTGFEGSLEGQMSPDKNLIVSTVDREDDKADFSVLVKRDSGFSQSDLAGDWFIQNIAMGCEYFPTRESKEIEEDGNIREIDLDSDGIATLVGGSDSDDYEGILTRDKNIMVVTQYSPDGDGGFGPEIGVWARQGDDLDPVNDDDEDGTVIAAGDDDDGQVSGCTVNPGQPFGLEWLILGLIGLGVYMRRLCRARVY